MILKVAARRKRRRNPKSTRSPLQRKRNVVIVIKDQYHLKVKIVDMIHHPDIVIVVIVMILIQVDHVHYHHVDIVIHLAHLHTDMQVVHHVVIDLHPHHVEDVLDAHVVLVVRHPLLKEKVIDIIIDHHPLQDKEDPVVLLAHQEEDLTITETDHHVHPIEKLVVPLLLIQNVPC